MTLELTDVVVQSVNLKICIVVACNLFEHAAWKCPFIVQISPARNCASKYLRAQFVCQAFGNQKRDFEAVQDTSSVCLTDYLIQDEAKYRQAALEWLKENCRA